MTKKILLIAIINFILLLGSCKNYYISKDSFIKQFTDIDSTKLRTVVVGGSMFGTATYKANPINKIKCVDIKGRANELDNGPSIETRITINNKKRVVFYFDRVIIIDSIVYGVQSRFLNIRTSIPLKDITKIEVQDGHKNFDYIRVDE
jgi:hypothetical protein